MWRGKYIEPFVHRLAFTVMTQGALERLLAPERLDQLLCDKEGGPYERHWLFSQIVDVVAKVVSRTDTSLRSSVRSLDEVLTESDEDIYQRLGSVESDFCRKLVQDGFEQARATLQELGVSLKSWPDGYRVKVIDGSAMQKSKRRKKESTTHWDDPLPGRMLVVWDQAARLVSDIVLCESGQAQERPLLAQVLETVERGQLWIGDQNFCALKFLSGLVSKGAFFVIRQHEAIEPKVLKSLGEVDRTANGEPIFEEVVEIEVDSQPMSLRRITVKLSQPTPGSDNEVHILTNVGDVDATGAKVADLYLKRWTSEAVFHEMTTVLKDEVSTLEFPNAALIVLSIAVITQNALAMLRGSIEAVHGPEKASEISGHALGIELNHFHAGMMVAIDESEWDVFRKPSLAEFVAVLRELAANIPLESYKKTKRGPKKPPAGKKA